MSILFFGKSTYLTYNLMQNNLMCVGRLKVNKRNL